MKYIKKFSTHNDYVSYVDGDNYITPNVSLCNEEKEVHYQKRLHDYSQDYFTVEALGDGNVCFRYNAWSPTNTQRYMEYSKDGGDTWTRATNVENQEVIMTIPLLTGETALVRGDNDTLYAYNDYENKDELISPGIYSSFFYSTVQFKIYGNIMSLLQVDDFTVGSSSLKSNMFYRMFSDPGRNLGYSQTKACYLVDAENLVLPSANLKASCFKSMFDSCLYLVKAPKKLRAKTLASECYSDMFIRCRSLTSAPELPATTLAGACYTEMFFGCTSLTTPPALPATTLAQSCYMFMFDECTSLTEAPELPATTLADSCYMFMFSYCRNLRYVKAMFIDTVASNVSGWLDNVAEIGTFVKNSEATWTSAGIPSGWTIETASE